MQTSNLTRHFQKQGYDVKRIFTEFNKPLFENIFFQNLAALKNNATYIEFDNNKWNMRPDMFCADKYKEPYFSYIILLVNNVSSFFLFTAENLPKILMPSKDQILNIIIRTPNITY